VVWQAIRPDGRGAVDGGLTFGLHFSKKKPAMHRPYLQATGTGCVFFPTSGGRQPTNFLDGLGR
jgi:hypothetical protein